MKRVSWDSTVAGTRSSSSKNGKCKLLLPSTSTTCSKFSALFSRSLTCIQVMPGGRSPGSVVVTKVNSHSSAIAGTVAAEKSATPECWGGHGVAKAILGRPGAAVDPWC